MNNPFQSIPWREWPERIWVPLFLTLTLFVLPISVSAKSIFLPIVFCLILFWPTFWPELKKALKTQWAIASLLLFIIALIATLWSPASWRDTLYVLEKYSKLVYLPILTVGFMNPRTRVYGLHAFILAMLITCLGSIYKYFFLPFGHDVGEVFLNHIITGYLMSFAAFLCGYFALQLKTKWRFVYGFLWLLFSYQVVFLNTGRTGLVIYLLLMGILFLSVFSVKQAFIAFSMGLLIFSIALYMHEGLQNRVKFVYHDLQKYKENKKDTPIGYRLQFHAFAEDLFSRSPWIGNGTGSFTYYYGIEKPVPSWDKKLREPHGLYWLVASEFGVLGLLSLFLFFITVTIAALKLRETRIIALALIIPFIIGNLTDSLLFYSAPGYFFILFMALCFGEGLEQGVFGVISRLVPEGPTSGASVH